MPGGGMESGSMQNQMGGSQTTGNGRTVRNPADDITAVAPPFDVEDVIRMHRVGLEDEVIINELRARYHPLKLSREQRALLIKNGVSGKVIAAMEDPWGRAPVVLQPLQETRPAPGPGASPAGLHPPASPARPDLTTAGHHDTAASGSLPGCSIEGLSDTARLLNPCPNGPITKTYEFPEPLPPLHLPEVPGIYRRTLGDQWVPLAQETVLWDHDPDVATRGVEGYVAGIESPITSQPSDCDLLIITPKVVSVVQYQLVRLHVGKESRSFHPTVGGDAFGGGANPDIVPYAPVRLASRAWIVSLRGLKTGDYGFLPPLIAPLHSPTGMPAAMFTFHVI